MQLSYERLRKQPYAFKRITALSVKEFEAIAHQVRPSFEELEAKKLGHGRNSHLPTLEDKLVCIFIYYRRYITHIFLGYLFNLHDSNICRTIKKIEPLYY
jgi:Helix-turn-helix of DDE superfamily endonuclease